MFLEKFCTAARTRPYGHQKLGVDFYRREHTKPFFNKHKILTVHNLYKYMSMNEIAKVLQSRTPNVLYENIILSSRNNGNLIILNSNSEKESCYHTVSTYWNVFIKKINIPNLENIVIPVLKRKLKKFLLFVQAEGDPEEWEPRNNYE